MFRDFRSTGPGTNYLGKAILVKFEDALKFTLNSWHELRSAFMLATVQRSRSLTDSPIVADSDESASHVVAIDLRGFSKRQYSVSAGICEQGSQLLGNPHTFPAPPPLHILRDWEALHGPQIMRDFSERRVRRISMTRRRSVPIGIAARAVSRSLPTRGATIRIREAVRGLHVFPLGFSDRRAVRRRR